MIFMMRKHVARALYKRTYNELGEREHHLADESLPKLNSEFP